MCFVSGACTRTPSELPYDCRVVSVWDFGCLLKTAANVFGAESFESFESDFRAGPLFPGGVFEGSYLHVVILSLRITICQNTLFEACGCKYYDTTVTMIVYYTVSRSIYIYIYIYIYI